MPAFVFENGWMCRASIGPQLSSRDGRHHAVMTEHIERTLLTIFKPMLKDHHTTATFSL